MGRKMLISMVVVVACGCSINYSSYSGRSFDHYADRQISVSSPLLPDGRISTDLTHMDITVIGQDTEQCALTADLSVCATSQEIADAVAEQLAVELVPHPGRLEVVLQKPLDYKDDYSVSGNITITVPHRTELELATTYGQCRIEQIQSNMNIRSSHGDLTFDAIAGEIIGQTTYGDIHINRAQTASVQVTTTHAPVQLSDCTIQQLRCTTTYGDIRLSETSAERMELSTSHSPIELTACTAKEATLNTTYGNIRGDLFQIERLTARTSHSPIDLRCINETVPNISATLNTTYGDIEFCPPAEFAGRVSASTSYGNIRTDQPITVQGVIGDKLNGIIGQGDGSITMTSSHGNITLKN